MATDLISSLLNIALSWNKPFNFMKRNIQSICHQIWDTNEDKRLFSEIQLQQLQCLHQSLPFSCFMPHSFFHNCVGDDLWYVHYSYSVRLGEWQKCFLRYSLFFVRNVTQRVQSSIVSNTSTFHWSILGVLALTSKHSVLAIEMLFMLFSRCIWCYVMGWICSAMAYCMR